jgi:hypothetical protein
MNDARSARDVLENKFLRGKSIRLRLDDGQHPRKNQADHYRSFAPLPVYKAIALLGYYIPLGFSTEILELVVEEELEEIQGRQPERQQSFSQALEAAVAGAEAVPGTAASAGDSITATRYYCRYSCSLRLFLHGALGFEGARRYTDSEALGEHVDASRLRARAVAQKKAKGLAMQTALSELVVVVDHVEAAAAVLFRDEL